MYIFKQANVGSEMTPQRIQPFYTLLQNKLSWVRSFSKFFHKNFVGMWIALDDGTEDNGCLWSVQGLELPGSQKRYKNEPKIGKEGK